MNNVIKNIFVILSVICVVLINWLYSKFNMASIASILFLFSNPIEGLDTKFVVISIICVVFQCVFWSCIALFITNFGKKHINRKIYNFFIICYIVSVIFMVGQLKVFGFIKNQITVSTFIEENYVDPSSVNINFDGEKKNLIYIEMESMENSFSDKNNGRSDG